MPIFSVFAVSLSTLFFEVLLQRSFAITQWVHLAFMVISIAMFGYSAGGVWMHVRIARQGPDTARQGPDTARRRALPLIAGASILGSWILYQRIPFDAISLPFSAFQALYLAAIFLLLAVPFFFAGVVTSIGFAERTFSPGVVYAASMTGSAAGAVMPALLLPVIGFSGCVLLSASIAAAPSLFRGRIGVRIGSAAFMAAVACLFLIAPDMDPVPSSYKELEKFMQHPNARILSTDESIAGRVDAYDGSGFHTAPGLSLSYRGPIPAQTGLFTDGGSPVSLYAGAGAADYQFALACVGAAPFALVPHPDRVLVLLESGGTAIAAALASGASEVDVLDFLPARASAVAAHYRQFGVSVAAGPLRTSMGRIEKQYEIIMIDHPGSSIPGIASINEDFLLTSESFLELLSHLKPGGVLSVSRRLQFPPSDSLKTLAIAFEALSEAGYSSPFEQICILRSYNTYLLMMQQEPIGESEAFSIRKFAADYGFDLVYLNGMEPNEANRHNRRSDAIYYDAVSALAADLERGSDTFTATYYADIRAPRDDRPYFNRFVRWRTLKELYEATGGRTYPFYFAGEILIVLVFGIALLFSLLIIVTPAIAAAVRRRPEHTSIGGANTPPRRRTGLEQSLMFLLLGAGFMFFEIGWIKRLIPLAGNTSLSFTTVLAILLVVSGFGGWLSERVERRHLLVIGLLGIASLVVSALGMKLVVPALLRLPSVLSWLIVFPLVALPGIFLGMPIPLLMRHVCKNPSAQILGWALSGTASVLASVASAGLVLFWGIQTLLWTALMVYSGVFALYALAMSDREK